MRKTVATLLALLFISGCSSKPVLESGDARTDLTPAEALQKVSSLQGTRVLWGGIIVNSTNLTSRSRLEILAYPLDEKLRPQTSNSAGRRFLAYRSGYLETVDYAAGRQVSLVGTISGSEDSKLGEHHYRYPTVEIEQLHLWSQKQEQSEPRVRFGFGLILHN